MKSTLQHLMVGLGLTASALTASAQLLSGSLVGSFDGGAASSNASKAYVGATVAFQGPSFTDLATNTPVNFNFTLTQTNSSGGDPADTGSFTLYFRDSVTSNDFQLSTLNFKLDYTRLNPQGNPTASNWFTFGPATSSDGSFGLGAINYDWIVGGSGVDYSFPETAQPRSLTGSFEYSAEFPTINDLIPPGDFTPVPEPSTYGLIGAGALLGLVVLRRRRAAATVKR